MLEPRTTHYAAVFRILQYIKGALYHGLYFSANSSLTLRAYSDTDWGGDRDDQRSKTGFCIFLDHSLIFYKSKKQTLASCSSAESEYCALADTTAEVLWLHWLLDELGASQNSSINIYCNSQVTITIAHNDVFHE